MTRVPHSNGGLQISVTAKSSEWSHYLSACECGQCVCALSCVCVIRLLVSSGKCANGSFYQGRRPLQNSVQMLCWLIHLYLLLYIPQDEQWAIRVLNPLQWVPLFYAVTNPTARHSWESHCRQPNGDCSRGHNAAIFSLQNCGDLNYANMCRFVLC